MQRRPNEVRECNKGCKEDIVVALNGVEEARRDPKKARGNHLRLG